MRNIKKIYIDRVDKNYNLKNSLALGPWCFDGIKGKDEIYNFYKKKHFKIINFNKNLLIKSRKKFYKKNIIFLSEYIKNKNKSKNLNLKVITEFISPWVLVIHDMFYINLRYVRFLKKNFYNKRLLIIKYYKPANLEQNNFFNFYVNTGDLNFFSSFVFFYLKKNKSVKWQFKCKNFEYKKKKEFNILIIFKKIKLFLEKIFFSNIIDVYSMNFYQKLIISRLLKEK